MRRFTNIPFAFNSLRISELNILPVANPPTDGPGLLAYVDLTLNDAIAIREIRVVQFTARRGVHFRDILGAGGKHKLVYPISNAARAWLEKFILLAYDRTVNDLRADEAVRRWSRAAVSHEPVPCGFAQGVAR